LAETTAPPVFYRAPDPDVTVRLDPAAEAEAHGMSVDEVGPAEDAVGWDLHFGARLTFGDDLEFGDGRGLHYHLAVGPDIPKSGWVIKKVTPAQIRGYAQALMDLADRSEARDRQRYEDGA
jgi:hypothetical protein